LAPYADHRSNCGPGVRLAAMIWRKEQQRRRRAAELAAAREVDWMSLARGREGLFEHEVLRLVNAATRATRYRRRSGARRR
jgi:hypothetical protein